MCIRFIYTRRKIYKKDTPKNENSKEIKVMPKEYIFWDNIDLFRPNIEVKNIINYFSNNYDDEIVHINYKKIFHLHLLAEMKILTK